MTDKKCVLRPALWAVALGGALVANAAFGVGGFRASGVAVAADDQRFYTAGAASAGSAAGAKTWDFDHDRGYSIPQDWTVVAGEWRVLIDRNAPSEPNTLGLPGYGLPHTTKMKLWFDSFFNDNYLLAIPKDDTEYTNFSYEASIKPWGGAFGSYAGLVFRYTDPQNYYVLAAACPKDTLTLYRMSGGRLNVIKEVPAELERGRWYNMKVDASGGHLVAYLDGKQMLDANDGSIPKGRIGVWSQNDSRVSFDNIKVTPAESASSPST